MVDWLKKNWRNLMPLATLFAGAIGGVLGVRLTVVYGPVVQPEITITLPQADGTTMKMPVKYATVEVKK